MINLNQESISPIYLSSFASSLRSQQLLRILKSITFLCFGICICSALLIMGQGPSKTFGSAAIKVITKPTSPTASGPREVATFAAGCFWGIELAFQRVPGVVSTSVGYTQGLTKSPSYENVCSGTTGHAEAVQVTFDANAITFSDLLTVFWDIHDPTTLNRQGNDVGSQYRSGIYYHSESQEQAAFASLKRQQALLGDHQRIVTEIKPASVYYLAEEYHQQYLAKGGQCSLTGDLTPIRCYG